MEASLFKSKDFRFIKVKRKEKVPLETNWQTYKNYAADDTELVAWIKQGNNIGVATGFGDLLVVDFDDKAFQDKFMPLLPDTLTQRSGSGGIHLFYKTDNPKSIQINDKEGNRLADIQGKGKQIIVQPSIHPNGKQYAFINDKDIAFLPYSQLLALFSEYLKPELKPKMNFEARLGLDTQKPTLSTILSSYGMDTSKKLTECLWHNSKGGQCFSFDDQKGLWNCFHCGKGGDVIKFVEEQENCSFKEACEKLDISLVSKTEVEIAQVSGKRIIEFDSQLKTDLHLLGQLIGEELTKCVNLFYQPYHNRIIEINLISNYDEKLNKTGKTQIIEVKEDRLNNLINQKITFIEKRRTQEGFYDAPVLLKKVLLSQIIKNDAFLSQLKELDKVMNHPYLFVDSTGLQIEFDGYSEKTKNYYTPDTPRIDKIEPDVAIAELHKILDGFCFEDETDKEIAISYLLTPALRGLYNDKRERTPCYALIANRPRAGKDYLAGIRSIIYSGQAIDNPPIADGDRANTDEWRKKFSTMLLEGQTIFHSANNVGYLNNPVFEALITSKIFKDRLLGSNEQKELDNYLDMSFSANQGLKWRGDMSGRLRRINLFYAEEDPNSRVFPVSDLHGYVMERRGHILSCIYSLIIDWHDAGKPCMDDKIFTSFPVWASICGGVMEYYNLGNPLIMQTEQEDTGNHEESVMADVYLLMLRWQQYNNKTTVKSSEIIRVIEEFQECDIKEMDHVFKEIPEDSLMNLSMQSKGDKIAFGKQITKFKGRILKGIRFKFLQAHKEAKHRQYSFEVFDVEKINND